MATEVFRNIDFYGSSVRPFISMLRLVLMGAAMVAIMVFAGVITLLTMVGILEPAPSWQQPKHPTPFWVQVVLFLVVTGGGIAIIVGGLSRYRKVMELRRRFAGGEALVSVQGHPHFFRGSKGGLLRLEVGGKEFSLVDNRGGNDVEDYAWGQATKIRGELRVWYPSESTEILARAEWLPYSAAEVAQHVDKIITENQDWRPNLEMILSKHADNPKVMADAERVISEFLKQIRDDCRKLEELKPQLLPGNSAKVRDNAEAEFDIVTTRIEFTKSSVISALKAVRALGV